jgi:mono/diheme cytochrome c family protein
VSVWRGAAWLGLGLALVACDALPGRPTAAARRPIPTDVIDFDTLYGQHCAGCHGSEARLGAARPLNDPVYLALVPRARLREVVANGVPGTAQPAFSLGAGGVLTERQIDAVVDGLIARWGAPGVGPDLGLPPYAAGADSPPGDPARGKAVFASACASCHGPDGRGGERAGSVVAASYLALVSDQSLRTTVIAGRADLGMPDWRGDRDRPLTPQQVSDVVAWLTAHRAPVTGRP